MKTEVGVDRRKYEQSGVNIGNIRPVEFICPWLDLEDQNLSVPFLICYMITDFGADRDETVLLFRSLRRLFVEGALIGDPHITKLPPGVRDPLLLVLIDDGVLIGYDPFDKCFFQEYLLQVPASKLPAGSVDVVTLFLSQCDLDMIFHERIIECEHRFFR